MEWRVVLIVLVFVFLALMEGFFPRRKMGWKRRMGVWPQHIFLVLLFQASMLLFPALVPVVFAAKIEMLGWGIFQHFEINPIVEFIIGFLALDLLVYGHHRLFHQWNFAWRFHRVHHSDAFLDASSAWRFHLGEFFLSVLLKILLIFLLGLSAFTVLIFELILGLMALLNHANWRWNSRLDKILSTVIVTPDFHFLHHDKRHLNQHYGTILSCWDVIFKSRVPYNQEMVAEFDIGINQNLPCSRVDELLVQPWYSAQRKD
jgi:sterol desaturase/sphingolipid hydroxylase (fatty acid hydroxylase superfamily)